MSELKANKISPSSGTTLTLADASDTITLATGVTLNVVDGVPVASGGTALTSFTAGDVLYATGTTTLAKLAKGTAEQILSMNSGATAPEWATAAATAGGTGQTGFTAGDILYANSTTTLTKLGKGTGLQGLQTNSGATAPEWADSPQSLMTAEGDVLYASGANTLAKLAKGSDDDVLTLASGVPSWAAPAGGGKVLQVTQGVYQAAETVSSNTDTFGAFSLSGTITPSATSSKVLITASLQLSNKANYRSFCKMMFDVGGGGYNDLPAESLPSSPGSRVPCHFYFNFPASHHGSGANVGFSYLHAPSTTSALTYKWYACGEAGGSVYMNRAETDTDNNSYGRSASRIILTELDYS